ncbi:DEAD/DEAH box helicase [Streptomyces flavofungini]|uniref:DEAD/DEAH box helicase n=1 Tax=Streptomyces flavofungini TaxID=68200 RepID=A0ABS0X357_9ACTN|nr:DEAD/DEAH box helicase [Streptomyces flavofungini]MBJ3807593.1 DEAD/DEAH box helicase [Streptomyces flavofungini]
MTAAGAGVASDGTRRVVAGPAADSAALAELVRSCAVVFLPADVPREGVLAWWRPDGGELPDVCDAGGVAGAGVLGRGEMTVVRRHGAGVRRRVVPALFAPVGVGVEVLLGGGRAFEGGGGAASGGVASGGAVAGGAASGGADRARASVGGAARARASAHLAAHPTAACWAAAARHALHLAARGKLLPGLTGADVDAWRAGPLGTEDVAHLRAIAAALPPEAHAVPLPGARPPLLLPEPYALVRAFVDAVVDVLPRTPAAAYAVGAPFAARVPQPLPGAREWAAEVAAGQDAGVRVSVRVDLRARDLFDGEQEGVGVGTGVGEGGGGAGGGGAGGGAGAAGAAAAVLQVHSLADPTLVVDAALLWAGAEHFGPRAKAQTLLAVRRAARVWPPLGRLLDRPRPDVLPLTEAELYDLLGATATRLGAAGVDVHWPRELSRELTATAVVRPAPGTAADNFDFFKTEQLLEFRWQLALGPDQGEAGSEGGGPLTEAEMDALAEAHRPIVRLRDQWVLVDPGLVRKARKRDLGLLDPVDALTVALTGAADVDGERVPAVPTGALAHLRERLTGEPRPVPQPPALKATLRDYQLRGLAWLDRMTALGLGGCLADDMGLGKTVTIIALHLHRARPAPTLVVCPTSLLGNWQREIERFAPHVPVRRFHGSGRSLDDVPDGAIVLTTYGTMRTSAAELAAHDWDLVVADEAQHVKNPHAATAKALRTIPAAARVALTGTPVENNLSELWALLDWTTPGLLGPLKAFRARHARLAETGGSAESDEAVARLARLVRPFLLRRKKSDPGIAPELPPKTESDHPAPLTREQTALYQAVVRETLARIEAADGIARRGLVMKLLMALKQICNHPAQYLKDGATNVGRARSGKLDLLDELLDTILSEGASVLVFTQYVEMARLLEAHLGARGVPTQLLHGGTPVAAREAMVDRFQAGEVPVFLLSLKAAGTGLNLTRASHVVHYDRWWNPAVEDQATDRAYRIGQTQPVQVHRLITEGTVEDRIAELLAAKQALADAVLGDGGEAALTELSDAELSDLVTLRRAR